MTLFDLMPSLWLTLAFVFLILNLFCERRVFLYGAGGAFFALCPAVLCLRIYVQCSFFFAYMITVFAVSRIARLKNERKTGAIALTKIDADGGYILYKGGVRNAYPRDPLFVCGIGDVLETELSSDGIIRAYRL